MKFKLEVITNGDGYLVSEGHFLQDLQTTIKFNRCFRRVYVGSVIT